MQMQSKPELIDKYGHEFYEFLDGQGLVEEYKNPMIDHIIETCYLAYRAGFADGETNKDFKP